MSKYLDVVLHPKRAGLVHSAPLNDTPNDFPNERVQAILKTIKASRSSHRSPLVFIAFLALSFMSVGCNRRVAPAAEKAPPAPVKWEEARRVLPEEWTEFVGTTLPLPHHAARVTSPVTARVVAVLPSQNNKSIAEGQLVEQGDILVQLDATAVTANLEKAQAAKKVLQAEREIADVALKQAALDLKSLEELKRTQSGQTVLVSPVMLEKANLALESAQATVRSLDRKLEAADKEIAAFNLEIRLYTLTAPRKGRLGRLQVVTGQTLSAGSTVAEVLSIDDEIDVLCFVSAADARILQVGQTSHVGSFGKEPSDSISGPVGKVVYIADQAETETGSFAVKIRFPNNELKLRASSITRVLILTNEAKPGEDHWTVPESAIMEDQEPPGIIIVEDVTVSKNAEGKEEQVGKARRLKVEIGIRARHLHQVEIIKLEDPEKKWHGGIENTLFVISKGQGLQTGDLVKLDDDDDDDAPKPEEKP